MAGAYKPLRGHTLVIPFKKPAILLGEIGSSNGNTPAEATAVWFQFTCQNLEKCRSGKCVITGKSDFIALTHDQIKIIQHLDPVNLFG